MTQTGFLLDQAHPQVVMPLKVFVAELAGAHSAYLRFDSVVMSRPPEGAFEVYIVDSTFVGTNYLSSTSPYFVHVINTYSLSEQLTRNMRLNASASLVWMKKEKINRPYKVVIIFRGNKLVSGGYSKDAGTLRVSRVALVEE